MRGGFLIGLGAAIATFTIGWWVHDDTASNWVVYPFLFAAIVIGWGIADVMEAMDA